ncbi:unnamed protein product (macronuclear) [Paramecium tetraurelia]|uniref:Serine/threonine-protein kinase PLK n=1 Tax=Paramecium tetraurelia TaxID=5888 RepID=A0EGB9_PARTE|nr:uncharacterized protein GSPATT00026684001 [Paramecium tetraurelia]CAK94360.1 unnamed protein product [Paramecium tetraurelia]|eukprot:XP_001461733.1 hypothetical protein (macronuclear) [Paramecium tetraurelia strain d4-2]
MDDKTNQEGAEQLVIFEEKITTVNGQVAIKKYQRGKFLGKGGFAKCYEATNLETKRVLAAKIIVKNSLTKNRARQKLISEIKIHKSLQNTNIVQFEHVFEDHENVYILLELCSNQTLNELIKRRKRLTEIEVQCYVGQIINALKYLHAQKVIHRDLKLGNLFLNKSMELKLGDFGLATKLEFEGEKKRTICGTPNYIAPEVLDGRVGHSFEVDIWSLGVIMYAMLIGKPPFETPDVKTTYRKIKLNQYSFPEHVLISDPAKSLITRILNLDPTQRPTLDEIMAHPFMNTGGTIPKTLPLSTLACPPSASYNKQFQPSTNTSNLKMSTNVLPQRLTETTPNNPKNVQKQTNGSSDRFPLQKPSSSGNIMDDNFGSSGLNNAQNVGYGGTQRPQSQKPNDIRNSQSQKTLSQPFGGTGMQGAQSVNNLGVKQNQAKSEVYVKKWVDYSSRYGLGYLLSNGAIGVFFNDSTKIVLDTKTFKFDYMERKGQDRQDICETYNLNTYNLDIYPQDLRKKVTLLQHFRDYLEPEPQTAASEENETKSLVYVKKWMKTRHAIMFRLSNKIVQVNFTDKTEIILSSEHKMVTYVNKNGDRSHYPLATALDSQNTEMSKRLKYTKEILTHMLNSGQNAGETNSNSNNQRSNPSWQNP